MALTPPTVASDPASAAHTNTALAAVTTFIATAYTEVIEGVNALRERAVKLGANNGFLEQVDAALANLGTGAGSAAMASPPCPDAGRNAYMRNSVILNPAYSSGARPMSLRPCTTI